MARFEIPLTDELEEIIKDLKNIDAVAPRMLKAAAPIAQDAIKKRLTAYQRTGALAKSVKARKPKKGKNGGWFLTIDFVGTDKDGSPNVVKAAGLEYGNSHQQPTPFMEAAARDCEEAVVDAMQAAYDLYLAEKELRG